MSSIARVVTKRSLHEPDPEAGWWMQRTAAERVSHLEELRANYYGWTDEARPSNEFISSCIAHNVRFLVVGGYAVAAHGHPRFTKDLDIWVWIDSENAQRLLAALEDFGFGGLDISAADFTEDNMVVQLGYPPNRIDLLTSLAGVSFERCWEHRIEVSVGDQKVPFIGIDDLIENKRAAGRPQDVADAAILTELGEKQ